MVARQQFIRVLSQLVNGFSTNDGGATDSISSIYPSTCKLNFQCFYLLKVTLYLSKINERSKNSWPAHR